MKLDHFVQREVLDPSAIETKSTAYLDDRRAQAEADKIHYALPEIPIRYV